MSTYTSKVRAYREARGLRQEQLADAIGVCRKTISQMEAEEAKVHKPYVVFVDENNKIAKTSRYEKYGELSPIL